MKQILGDETGAILSNYMFTILLTLSVVRQSFIWNLFPREAEINILAFEILEDGSILALDGG